MDYASYLQVGKLLECQGLESARDGQTPAHDEMLFIIIHQTYELWFKQILWELDKAQAAFAADYVDEREMGGVIAALERVISIQKVLNQQIDVLETMTPMDFLEFRDLLVPASGFQSAQFRLIETRLGLPRSVRLKYDNKAFDDRLPEDDRAKVTAAEDAPSLLTQLDHWLARTPFVAMGDYAFETAYGQAIHDMLDGEARIIDAQPFLTDEEKQVQKASLDRSRQMLRSILDAEQYEAEAKRGGWRMTRNALQAALFINLYRDEPALQMPHRLLAALMDIDEGMSQWRYRHALMAQRMIGRKVGTGGSSGHDYLARSAEQHRVFGDLFALATFMLPRAKLPPLPGDVARAMGYRYQTELEGV
ncbi:MAG: hypothetical protein Alpg2KO_14760 [Alphaproteobacteria bacterium]